MVKKLVAAATTLALLGGLGATAAPVYAAPGSQPDQMVISKPISHVVIVPGKNAGRYPYTLLAHQLRLVDSYKVKVMKTDSVDVQADAAEIGKVVQELRKEDPKATIALLGHGAGALAARAYLKLLGGHKYVTSYISMAASEYGNSAVCNEAGPGRQLCPFSDFLNKLNKGDDTPGKTAYFAINSAGKWVDGSLDGGQCRVTPVAVPAIMDAEMHYKAAPMDPRMWTQVEFILETGRCDGTFVNDVDGALIPKK